MKKIWMWVCGGVVLLSCFIILGQCASTKNQMVSVQNGAFTVTPSQVIENLNRIGIEDNYPQIASAPEKTSQDGEQTTYTYRLNEDAVFYFKVDAKTDYIKEVKCYIPYADISQAELIRPMIFYMGVLSVMINPQIDTAAFQSSINFSAFARDGLQEYKDKQVFYQLFTLNLAVDYTIVPA